MSKQIKKDENWTHIVALIDRSGSMGQLDSKELSGAANQLIIDQLKNEDSSDRKVTATIANFDDSIEILKRKVDGKDVKLTEKDIVPRGMTALIPSVARLIRVAEKDIEDWKTTDYQEPGTIVFILLSDGAQTRNTLENREAADAPYESVDKNGTNKNLAELVKKKESVDQWKFFFLGANMDVKDVGNKMGFNQSTCMHYNHTTTGGTNALRGTSNAIGRFQRTPIGYNRSTTFEGFTQVERNNSQAEKHNSPAEKHNSPAEKHNSPKTDAHGVSMSSPISVGNVPIGESPIIGVSPIISFSHQQWEYSPWETYTFEQSTIINNMMNIVPSGSVLLPGTEFEIRWGDLATSQMMSKKPFSGIIQVNRNTGFTRVVRRD